MPGRELRGTSAGRSADLIARSVIAQSRQEESEDGEI